MSRGRKMGIAALLAVLGVGTAVALWPTEKTEVGYPFARRVLGEQPQPLWQLDRERFVPAVNRDTSRAERAVARLDAVVQRAEAREELLAESDVEELSPSERQLVRLMWWSFLEPLLELDTLKHRWEAWYGVDYQRNPDLHAMAYGLTYASLAAQVSAGQALLEMVEGNDRIQAMFDEAMPELGLPANTFTTFRNRMTRARDQSFIAVGGEWFDTWIAQHLEGDVGTRIAHLVRARRALAEDRVDAHAALTTIRNKAELLERAAFESWFPVQRDVAEWFGDTRVVDADRRLISDQQLEDFGDAMEPGDIIVERRNWYLSNVGLPGFWPHAALYVGTQEDIRAAFDDDEEVRARWGRAFSEHLAASHPEAWAALGESDHQGHPHRILEAVSEGVVAASIEHSCGADYVAAMRPNLDRVLVARAIDRAMSYFGRPYDFDFDFATDDEVVCSELVMKAYEPEGDGPGLRVPSIEVVGKIAIPPTEIVRAFANERESQSAQLAFVYFLDGRERGGSALVADAQDLAASVDRPKWDLLQE